jgi:hypothetical protein
MCHKSDIVFVVCVIKCLFAMSKIPSNKLISALYQKIVNKFISALNWENWTVPLVKLDLGHNNNEARTCWRKDTCKNINTLMLSQWQLKMSVYEMSEMFVPWRGVHYCTYIGNNENNRLKVFTVWAEWITDIL